MSLPSPVPDQRQSLTARECVAMRLLSEAGWSRAELAMVFELTDSSLDPHLNADCAHDDSHVTVSGGDA